MNMNWCRCKLYRHQFMFICIKIILRLLKSTFLQFPHSSVSSHSFLHPPYSLLIDYLNTSPFMFTYIHNLSSSYSTIFNHIFHAFLYPLHFHHIFHAYLNPLLSMLSYTHLICCYSLTYIHFLSCKIGSTSCHIQSHPFMLTYIHFLQLHISC